MPARIFVGVQWGDEGKGKVAHVSALRAHICVRYQGGNNAGHTIYDNVGRRLALHAIPVGVLHGAICIIEKGCVIHPESLLAEIDELSRMGISCAKLMISPEAHIVMPWHRAIDWAREREKSQDGETPIGTTLRGIGPCYEDKAARHSAFRMNDLQNPHTFFRRLETVYKQKEAILATTGFGREALANPDLFPPFDVLRRFFADHIAKLVPYIREDTAKIIRYALQDRKQVDFEGAQGTLLDPDWGTYPYVTSASTLAGTALSLISAPRQDIRIIGVAKAYPTRVGHGPFPTEIHGALGERLRDLGSEFGATTGRPRRCGWFDTKLTRYASYVNGGFDELIITKLDILGLLDTIRLSTRYQSSFVMSRIHEMVSEYENLVPWGVIDPDTRSRDELPEQAQHYLTRIEELTRLNISAISIGGKQREIITF